MNDINKLAQLAHQSNVEGLDQWETGRLEDWLSWLDASGCVFACYQSREETDKPLGFAVVRPLRNLQNKHQNYRIDKNGQILFVDMAVAQTADVLRALGFAVLNRYGQRQWLASERKGKLHLHNMSSVRKALLRKH